MKIKFCKNCGATCYNTEGRCSDCMLAPPSTDKKTNSQETLAEKKKKGCLGWFDISTKENCESAIAIGWLIIVINSCLSTFEILHLIAQIKQDPIFSIYPIISYTVDYAHFVNIFVYFILAFFIYKKSRIASTLVLLIFIINKLFIAITPGIVSVGPLLWITIIAFLFNSMRATYVWHSQYKNPIKINGELINEDSHKDVLPNVVGWGKFFKRLLTIIFFVFTFILLQAFEVAGRK